MTDRIPSRLIVLADGALLYERNARSKEGGDGYLDFNRLPELVAGSLGMDPSGVVRDDCYFFMIGAQNAEQFTAKISSAWTVQAFPLRSFATACACGRNTVRFTAAIAWALGSVGSRARQGDCVVAVSNDVSLVMPLRFARDQQVDARMAWPDSLGEEARFFAERNEVPTIAVEVPESSVVPGRQSFGRLFLRENARAEDSRLPRRTKRDAD
jgi:hypothetical protein